MNHSPNEDDVLNRLITWGEGQTLVRAMVLTSTRAVPGGPVDALSDYDVILVLRDVGPYHASRDWLAAFGRVLVLYRDPLQMLNDSLDAGYVIQFEEGLKIDFSLWVVAKLQRIAAAPELPPELDAGYRVLLDKDGLTAGLRPPGYRGYIPLPPSQVEFIEKVENFLLDATYVAKLLWRDDLVAARFILDNFMKHEHLLPVLEWHAEIAHEWSLKPGPYGRRIKQWLRSDLWGALESTYTYPGPGLENTWAALERTIGLMRQVAEEVGAALGYAYPAEMHQKTMAHLEEVKRMASDTGRTSL